MYSHLINHPFPANSIAPENTDSLASSCFCLEQTRRLLGERNIVICICVSGYYLLAKAGTLPSKPIEEI